MGGCGSKMCTADLLCCIQNNGNDKDKYIQPITEDQTPDSNEKLVVSDKSGETLKGDSVGLVSAPGAKKCHEKRMQEDTDSDEEKPRRSQGPPTQVIEYVGVMQFGSNSKVINNTYINEPKKKKKPPPHKDQVRSKAKPGGGEKFRKAIDDNISGLALEMLNKSKESVGIIRGPGTCQGTGFLLKEGLVMTAAHVIKDLKDRTGNLDPNHTQDKKISIQFSYHQPSDANALKQTYFYFASEIPLEIPDLDVVILQLIVEQGQALPEPLEHFSPVQQHMKGHMIGHPKGDVQMVDPNIERYELSPEMSQKAIAWSIEKYNEDGYRGIEDSRKILFHCKFTHGASGSPGLYTDTTRKNAEVVWMFLEGYPGFYHKKLNDDQKAKIPENFLIEQGITMKSIWEEMSKNKTKLCRKIFGLRDANFMPISSPSS